MAEPIVPPFRATAKYNPHLWGDDELRAIFVTRTRELAEILDKLRAAPPDAVPQHLLITGQRGMGKTTLLRRIALAVAEDAELARRWIALTFPEEQYTVSTLAELWSNVLDALADTLEREGVPASELARLDAEFGRIEALPPPEREAAALALLDGWVKQHGRRLLLLIDSTDLLFSGLASAEAGGARGKRAAGAGATALWRLRKTLSHDPALFWLGASYQALESSHQYSDAFHDFFELLELRSLSVADMREAMIALARTFGASGEGPGDAAAVAMARTLDARPERLKTLRAITGGNPRTTVILYDLFAAGWQDDLHTDLKVLLDAMSPLYKSRMELLAEQPRKLLAHLMERWAPMAVKDLAEVSGIPNTTVSGQLTRLEAEGLVEKTKLPGTSRAGWQVAERFFNIWYLMRYTARRMRQRLTWLVEFMRLWYSGEELQTHARTRLRYHGDGRLADSDQLEYSLALASALPDDCQERHRLEYAVFSSAWQAAEKQRQSLAQAFPELFDLEGEDRPFRSAEDYLRRFKALDEKLGRCPHAASPEQRQAWVEAVKGSLWLTLEEKEKVADEAETLNESRYAELMQAFSEQTRTSHSKWGDVYDRVLKAAVEGDFFPDCPDAELAYRQIMARFGDDAEAVKFCVELMAKANPERWIEKACQLVHNDADCWFNLGVLLQDRLHRYDEAEAAYRKTIELNPQNAYSWNNLGVLLQDRLHRYDEAEAAYRKAIELNPQNAYSWNNLGVLLQDRLHRYDEAEAAYRKAIELDQQDATLWSGLSTLLQAHLHRYGEAETAYRKAIELDPQNANTWSNFGTLLQDQLYRYDEAEAAYRKAIELDSSFPYPTENLARLLAQTGRKQAADEAYRKAVGQAGPLVDGEGGIGYTALLLQAQLWLDNRDVARLALERLAQFTSEGDASALFRLREQARECHTIGLGAALSDLMASSAYADFLRPMELALRAAAGDAEALDGIASEIRTMAEEVLAEILRPAPGS